MSQVKKKKRMGEILVEAGVIDELQLSSALAHQKMWGGRLGAALLKLNLVNEARLVGFLAKYFRFPAIDFSRIKIERDVLDLIPEKFVLQHQIIPLFVMQENKREYLCVAMSNPDDFGESDAIKFATRKEVKPVVASDTAIDDAIAFYYQNKGNLRVSMEAKPSSAMTYDDLVEMTKVYLAAFKEPMAKGLGDSSLVQSGGGSISTPPSSPANTGGGELNLSALSNLSGGDDVVVFSDAGESSFSFSDPKIAPRPVAAPEPVAEEAVPATAADINTEKVLKALIKLLQDKGIITRAELIQRLKG